MAKKSLILPQWRTIKSNTRTVYKPPANRRYTVVVKYYSVGRMQKKKFLISIYGKAGTLYPASNKQALSLQANKYAMHACSTYTQPARLSAVAIVSVSLFRFVILFRNWVSIRSIIFRRVE